MRGTGAALAVAVFAAALARPAAAGDRDAWSLKKGEVLRYELTRSLEGFMEPESRYGYEWKFVLALTVTEVGNGSATLDAVLEAAVYESRTGGAPVCRFDSRTDMKKGETDLDPALRPWRAAIGRRLTVRVRLNGRIEEVTGLEAMFATETTAPWGPDAARVLREMLGVLFLDRSVPEEDGWRLGTSPWLARPDTPLDEDVRLAAAEGGFRWKGALSAPPPEDPLNQQPVSLKPGWTSEGTAAWAGGRLTSLHVETAVEYVEPVPVRFKLVREVALRKK